MSLLTRVLLQIFPTTVVLIAGLGVIVASRRRLGRAAPPAIAGFSLLAFGALIAIGWAVYVDQVRSTASADLMEALYTLVSMVEIFVNVLGLVLAVLAVFAGRRATTAGR